jgi:hypothetical protein
MGIPKRKGSEASKCPNPKRRLEVAASTRRKAYEK